MNKFKKTISMTLIFLMLSSNILYAAGGSLGDNPTDTVDLPIDEQAVADGANFDNAESTKATPPLYNIFGSTEWSMFFKEFEIEMKIGTCGCGEDDGTGQGFSLDCAIGLKAHMIEPLGYFERVNKPLYFAFADIDLHGNIFKFNNPYYSGQDDEGDSPRENALFAHFIFFPIFGIIFKKKLNFVCFHKGDLDIPYISEFDPTSRQDYYFMKMIPHMIAMFSPDGLLSTFFDCAATMVSNSLRGYSDDKFTSLEALQEGDSTGYTTGTQHGETTQSIIDFSDRIRNALWFIDGCNGFAPIGQYENGQDPIIETTNSFYGIANVLHGASSLFQIEFLSKQTNADFNSFEKQMQNPLTLLNSMCKPQKFPLIIASQYALQLAYPTVGNSKETGSTAIEVSKRKNVQDGGANTVFIPWIRRDYYAFAYYCPGSSTDSETDGNI